MYSLNLHHPGVAGTPLWRNVADSSCEMCRESLSRAIGDRSVRSRQGSFRIFFSASAAWWDLFEPGVIWCYVAFLWFTHPKPLFLFGDGWCLFDDLHVMWIFQASFFPAKPPALSAFSIFLHLSPSFSIFLHFLISLSPCSDFPNLTSLLVWEANPAKHRDHFFFGTRIYKNIYSINITNIIKLPQLSFSWPASRLCV